MISLSPDPSRPSVASPFNSPAGIVTAWALCALMFPGVGLAQTCTVYCPDGSRPNVSCNSNVDPCSSGGGSSNDRGNSGYDHEAARRAQAAAAAAAEERRRQQEEDERIERQRLAALQKKKAAQDAEFIRRRDQTVLKGSLGTTIAPNSGTLKGSGLVDTGLKAASPGDRAVRDLQGQHAAWKQLHCAAALSGYAFAASKQTTPDLQESSYLLGQAMNALNGQALGVECPSAPSFPDLRGGAVDMDQVRDAQKKLVGRATVIVERLKQNSVPPAASAGAAASAPETGDEKLRRVQRELNRANSRKITGQTQPEIDQQEQDRKELAKLVLANERLEKGDLTAVSADTREDDPAPRPRRRAKTAPR